MPSASPGGSHALPPPPLHQQLQLDATVKGRVARLEAMPNVDVWGGNGHTVDVMVHKRDVAVVDPAGEGKVVLANVQEYIERMAPSPKRYGLRASGAARWGV